MFIGRGNTNEHIFTLGTTWILYVYREISTDTIWYEVFYYQCYHVSRHENHEGKYQGIFNHEL